MQIGQTVERPLVFKGPEFESRTSPLQFPFPTYDTHTVLQNGQFVISFFSHRFCYLVQGQIEDEAK